MTDTQASPPLAPRRFEQRRPADRAPRSPSGRGRGLLLLLALAALVGLAVAAWTLTSRAEGVTYLTEPARVGDLEDRVEAPATLIYAQDATADLRAPAPGVVTALRMSEGQAPPPLATLLDLNGVPLTALVSPLPLYRDLAEGVEGDDVRALEDALNALGHDPGEIDGVFDRATTSALRQWQEDSGVPESGTLPLAQALWLPPGAQIVDVRVRPGDVVEAGLPLAGVARPDGRVVTAAVDPADAGRVALDDAVEVELDGIEQPLTGAVTAIPPSSGEDGTFPVTVRVGALPETARVGMEGSAYVLVDRHEGVVVVPVGAVSGTDEAPTVRVLVGGAPETRAVELGLVTSAGAEIVAGVAPGEAVIVGERED